MISKLLKITLFTLITISPSTSAFAKDRMKVLTTFTVLADMAANVAGDAADVVSITKPGAEIHGYEPTPQDIVRASDADLILWNGMNLELWFEQFLSNMKDVPSVTLTEGIDPISISSGSYEGMPNPHAWMGLDNAIIYIDNILKAFIAVERICARYRPKVSRPLCSLGLTVSSMKSSPIWNIYHVLMIEICI